MIDEYDDYWDEDCDYNGWGAYMPGVEDCEFTCPMRRSCREFYESKPDCTRDPDDIRCRHEWMGKCYAGIGMVRRFFCRWRIFRRRNE